MPVRIVNHQGWAEVEITSPKTTEVSWEVLFEPAEGYHFPVKEPQHLWAERVGVDGANLHWAIVHQPAAGYQVSLNGTVLGFTPSQGFYADWVDARLSK